MKTLNARAIPCEVTKKQTSSSGCRHFNSSRVHLAVISGLRPSSIFRYSLLTQEHIYYIIDTA